MHEITLADLRCVYLGSVAEIALLAPHQPFHYKTIQPPPAHALEMIGYLKHVRPLLVPAIFGRAKYTLYFVRWPVDRDLIDLDGRVADSTSTAEDFTDAEFTGYMEAGCQECGSRWHVLVVDFDLRLDVVEKLAHEQRPAPPYQACPQCGHSLRQVVTDILAPAGCMRIDR